MTRVHKTAKSMTPAAHSAAFFEVVYREFMEGIQHLPAEQKSALFITYSTALGCALDEGLELLDAVKKAGAVTANVLFGNGAMDAA